ncbi:leukocyte elastase inhibitor A [Manacus vitellinus]|nr:leukocyte elastase inhibitor A [Manacus vitellinus]XP_051654905.1 leukocyte elastase inhibitor A-like [Manacus candei]
MCSLSAANAKFCLDFFRELNKRKRNENIFFSPLSLSAAFGMVVLGARGNTLEQIEKVFHFSEVLSSVGQSNRDPSEKVQLCIGKLKPTMKCLFSCLKCEEAEGVHSQFQALLAEVSEPSPGCCLTIANRLFGEITYPFFQQYLDSTKKFYRAELEPVNFKYTEEVVREKINFWVENETKGKIKDLFSTGFIDPSTVLVLVNAMYFKGKWAAEFKKEDTKEAYFHLNKNESRTVQMMFQEGYFNMAILEEPKMKVIELLYFNNELSMFILLPEDDCEDFTGLEQLECALTYEKLAEWTSSARMEPLKVKVYLPQFKMEESYVLNKTLQEMGVMNVFDWGKADLSGISKKGGLVVSKAIQKTIVEVNEEGTEAACATGLLAMPLCCPLTYEFKADHPFLFFIRHNQTNTILFFGRYCSP